MRLPRLLPLTIVTMAAVLCLRVAALFGGAGDGAPPPRPNLVAPAEAAAPAPVSTPPNSTPKPAPQAAPQAAPPLAPAGRAAEEPPVLQDLRKRRQELDARQAALDARANALDAAEHALQARAQEMQALQKKLEALDARRHTRSEADWRGLVKMYEAMRPRDAAVIFNDLDLHVLLQVLDRMKERKAAPILAAMQPGRARQVTEQLAALRMRRDGGATP